MTEREIPFPETNSREEFSRVIQYIAQEREKKGTSETLIPFIREVRKSAEERNETSNVVQLYQEEFLCGQHMVMEEKAKGKKANVLRTAKGLLTMETTNRAMEKYLQEGSLDLDPVIESRIYRYLGRYADYKHQYKKSENYYRCGLFDFEHTEKPEDRYNRLEFAGFLSYSLLKQGKTREGLDMVETTLMEFDESPDGKWLKENNYYTWAVWKSGIDIRTAEFILEAKAVLFSGHADRFIKDAEKILVMPDGTKDAFQLRLDELTRVKELWVKTKYEHFM